MAALISILLEMPKDDAMSSTGFSIGTTWAIRICKEKKLYQSDRGPTPWHPDYMPLCWICCNIELWRQLILSKRNDDDDDDNDDDF